MRRLLKEHVVRGHVEISVGLTGAGAIELEIDRKLLAAYLKGYQTLKQEFGAGAEPDLLALLRVPGLVSSGSSEMAPEKVESLRLCWSVRWCKLWRS